jgi:hypothetical protein
MIETFERDYLGQMLMACDGNISRAAREARKDRRTFFGLLKKTRPHARSQKWLKANLPIPTFLLIPAIILSDLVQYWTAIYSNLAEDGGNPFVAIGA